MEAITKKEYNRLYKDYKTIIDNQHYILKLTKEGTCLVPVKIIK